jgi:hypothetical protein
MDRPLFSNNSKGPPDKRLVEAIKFFAFILLICGLITLPIEYAIWHLDVTDTGVVLSSWIMYLAGVLFFCASLHITARVLGSTTDLRSGLTAMFFSTAYLPFLEASKYLDRTDPLAREIVLGRELDITLLATRPLLIVSVIVQLALISYVVYKLAEVVKITYSFGGLRAVITIFMAGITYVVSGFVIFIPIWTAILERGARP